MGEIPWQVVVVFSLFVIICVAAVVWAITVLFQVTAQTAIAFLILTAVVVVLLRIIDSWI